MRKTITFINPGIDLGDKKDGDTIEAIVEIEVEEGGKLCLKSINGIPLEDDSKEEASESEMTSGERVMKRAMSA